jgi:serine/threonine protein kinase
MEYLRGKVLSDVQEDNKPLDYGLSFHIFYQLCKAMGAAHRAGVIHRDLKPDNLFLIRRDTDPNFVKVIDFGLARPEDTSAQSSITQQQVMGTPAYMSPEQCSGDAIDTRSDIYAMGVMLYQMLTGRHPFPIDPSDTMSLFFAHLSKVPTMPRDYNEAIPKQLEEALLVSLSKRPEDRFATAELFWDAVAPCAPEGTNYPSLSGTSSSHFHGGAALGAAPPSHIATPASLDPMGFQATAASVEAVSMDAIKDIGEDETFVLSPVSELLHEAKKPEAEDTNRNSGAHSPPAPGAKKEEFAFAPTMGLPSFADQVALVDDTKQKEGDGASQKTDKEKPSDGLPDASEAALAPTAGGPVIEEVVSPTADTGDLDETEADEDDRTAMMEAVPDDPTLLPKPVSLAADSLDDDEDDEDGGNTTISQFSPPEEPKKTGFEDEDEKTSISMAPSFLKIAGSSLPMEPETIEESPASREQAFSSEAERLDHLRNMASSLMGGSRSINEMKAISQSELDGFGPSASGPSTSTLENEASDATPELKTVDISELSEDPRALWAKHQAGQPAEVTSSTAIAKMVVATPRREQREAISRPIQSGEFDRKEPPKQIPPASRKQATPVNIASPPDDTLSSARSLTWVWVSLAIGLVMGLTFFLLR